MSINSQEKNEAESYAIVTREHFLFGAIDEL